MTTILDTNIWVALFHNEDSLHDRAVEMKNTLTFPLGVPEFIVAETCTVLARTASKAAADTFIDYTQNTAQVELLLWNRTELENLLSFYQREPHRGLSFVDVALLWLSRSYPVMTFDKRLGRAITSAKK